MRQATLTLTGSGMRTLSCVPTDSLGAVGAAGTLSASVVTGPTVTINHPGANQTRAPGDVPVVVAFTTDPSASPATVTAYDSIEGGFALSPSGAGAAGTVTSPLLGYHDLHANVVDACGGSVSTTVRYAITSSGGPATTLYSTALPQTSVLAAAADGSIHFIQGTNNGLQRFDVTTGNAVAYQPNTGMSGSAVPMVPVVDISLGQQEGAARKEAFATNQGFWACTHFFGANPQPGVCTHIDQNQGGLFANDVRAVLVVGSGVGASVLAGCQ